jgi:hypothetical protein
LIRDEPVFYAIGASSIAIDCALTVGAELV